MRGCRRRLAATLSVVTGIAAAAALGVAPAGASPAGASCPPVSAAQLHAILGLPSSMQGQNTVDDSAEVSHYLCNAAAWSGPTPTSFQAALQTAKAGHGAAFGIEVWQPNESGDDVQTWKDRDYARLRYRLLHGYATFPGLFTNAGWPSKPLKPKGLGHPGAGFVVIPGGTVKGLVAAIGCWRNDDAYTAVCILVEEAVGKPVVQHLNQLATIAVPKVL
jgi:hypothetical protein